MQRPSGGSVPVEISRVGRTSKGHREGRLGRSQRGSGDAACPTDGTAITATPPPSREEASTFSEGLSDAVARGASEGTGEGRVALHTRGTSEGPGSS